jgi:N-acetyl-D-muramate 6-phosphate phosphatase
LQKSGSVRADVRAVLFDLDGTLIDSAPDLAAAANHLRTVRGIEPLPMAALRPMVGSGARGMVGLAFGVKPGDDQFDALRTEFLDRYAAHSLVHTAVFEHMVPVLAALDARQVRWGIVTNKAERYTQPIVAGLGLAQRAAVVISGDTTPHSKPHPAPLIEAAERMRINPRHCVYVGDDMRDIRAGKAAGMAALAAAWGYLGDGLPIDAWEADHILQRPSDLLHWLQLP